MKAQATRFTVIANFLLVAIVALAACAPASTPAPTAVPPSPAPPTAVPPTAVPPTVAPTAVPAAKPVSLQLAKDAGLGQFLADGNGMSLYMFTQDTKDTSNCYDKCAAAWPPLLTPGAPTVQTGVDATLVGTTQRKDGTTQVTYNHWPLYYWASDQKAGDVTGQGVGKVWWVLSGEGFIIRPAALMLATDAKLGKFLADGNGLSLYIFTKDTKDTSNCYDKCAVAWPPLLTTNITATVQSGVDASLLGTTQRKDGSKQVTYNHLPLYYFASDQKAGDVTGQGVAKVWWVLSGEGFTIQPATLMLATDDKLGKFLADGNGLSLYLFTKDTKDTSNCYDKCAAAWPPLLTTDVTATVQSGVDASLLATTQRKDGSMQVTYNHWPLYYFASDQKAGDVTGQAIGKVWWVLSGEGNLIRPAALTLATDSKLGKFLADGSGESLYVWAKDTPGAASNCSGKCEQAWPPLLTVGAPTVGDGVTGSLVGTVQRKDGSMQVTYKGLPVYYFTSDQKPGDVMGQGVGNVWYVVGADGNMIK